MTDLLPCPFCGSDKIQPRTWSVCCEHCGATGPDQDYSRDDWNTRSQPVERLVEIVESQNDAI